MHYYSVAYILLHVLQVCIGVMLLCVAVILLCIGMILLCIALILLCICLILLFIGLIFLRLCLCTNKVIKLHRDTVGRGWHPPPRYQDKIRLNRWTKSLKPVVLDRIQAVAVPPHTHGRQPKLGNIPRAIITQRWYIQLDVNELHMLVIPLAFQQDLKEWIKIPLPPQRGRGRLPLVQSVGACRLSHRPDGVARN
jgi:hypothetical protein